jgi:hypothetical protein
LGVHHRRRPAGPHRPRLTSWLPSRALREITSSHTEIGQLAPAAAAALLLAYLAALITATLVLDRTREI